MSDYTGVREALRHESPLWRIEHLDITCDGCLCEPIIGARFKCTVCEDIDLCGACMRALVAARLKMAQEGAAMPGLPRRQGQRPRKWVAKLHSRDLTEKWAALQTAVPCLHPSHQFQKVVDGPERAVVFLADGQPASGNIATGGCSSQPAAAAGAAGPQQQDEQQEEQQASQEVQAERGRCAVNGSSRGINGGSSSSSSALGEFLSTFRPSAASCRDVAWIIVAHPEPSSEQPSSSSSGSGNGSASAGLSLEQRVDAAVEEWELKVQQAAFGPGRRLTAADVDALAAKHRILKGKWMLFARSGAEADAAWAAVAKAVCAEPRLCDSAKVSSAGPEADGSWVLCVYTENYHDSEDVQRVCRGLQRALRGGLLQDRRLLYKPDVYTHLGIYSKNQWQLKPTVFEARLL
ncbi:hypothetical protein D9Q98_002014 [Chlorella vulgaris]|uniref:ZZ-type domain-containing protein n=1 Tax=Chlorella vulgaris TaxID=3077 RepID=A0A9D4TVG4_CHLVU|nr:hypothetical protein D9Q98_002014 [Chlorella vulgaris]